MPASRAVAVAEGCVLRSGFELEVLERRALLSGDAILDWNAVALQAVADDHTPSVVAHADEGGPTRTSRALAIVHAAMFDAFNGIDGSCAPYLKNLPAAPKGASCDAAVAQAAHDTLAALYPHQAATFDAALAGALAKCSQGTSGARGVAWGRTVAAMMLASRAGDHAGDAMSYAGADTAGTFQMFPGDPSPLTPQWGNVTPFTMTSGSEFLAPPPPALDSPAYAAAYNEVKNYGGNGTTTPTLRTAEQTDIGIFWGYDGTPGLGTPPRFYNQIARVVAGQAHNTEAQNARLFALVNLAMADAGIASWGTKYAYDFWRPVAGIRQVGPTGTVFDDGNPATAADPTWTPLGAPFTNASAGQMNFTPPFPAYTSGHATFGAALFETLKDFYGTDDVRFTVVSDEFNGVNRGSDGVVRPYKPRTFTSFSQAMEENGQSRIYLGIHWSFDKTAGIAQGRAIADQAFADFLTPVRPGGGHETDVAASTAAAYPSIVFVSMPAGEAPVTGASVKDLLASGWSLGAG